MSALVDFNLLAALIPHKIARIDVIAVDLDGKPDWKID